jgi:hypothetical protein
MATKKKAPAQPARTTKPASATMVPELLRRLEALEKREPEVATLGSALGASMDKAVMEMGGELRGSTNQAAESRRLPSAFQINDPVFVRFGEQFVPARVQAVQFDEGSVYYSVQTSGPFLAGVWGGYVVPRDIDAHNAGMVDGPAPAPVATTRTL